MSKESYLPWRRRDTYEMTGQIGLQEMVKVLEFNILSFEQCWVTWVSSAIQNTHFCFVFSEPYCKRLLLPSLLVHAKKRPSRLSSTALYVYPANTVYTAYTVNIAFTAYTVAHMPIYNTLIERFRKIGHYGLQMLYAMRKVDRSYPLDCYD